MSVHLRGDFCVIQDSIEIELLIKITETTLASRCAGPGIFSSLIYELFSFFLVRLELKSDGRALALWVEIVLCVWNRWLDLPKGTNFTHWNAHVWVYVLGEQG